MIIFVNKKLMLYKIKIQTDTIYEYAVIHVYI